MFVFCTSFRPSALAGILLSLFVLSTSIAPVHAAPLRSRRFRPAERDNSPPSPPDTPEYQPLTQLKPQQPDFLFDLTTSLYLPSSTLATLSDLPATCQAVNSASGECTTDMVATNVTYDDCTDAFTVCRCTDANMTMSSVVDRLGRVPVGLRKFASTIVVNSAPDMPHAYTLTNGEIHMFGDTQMETWLHESTHAYDFALGSPYSGTQQWLDAIGNDTCATDTYGTSNAVEEFAQLSVLQIFRLTHNGDLPAGWSADCMSNQLAFLGSLPLFNSTTLFANTCAIGSDAPLGTGGNLAASSPSGTGSSGSSDSTNGTTTTATTTDSGQQAALEEGARHATGPPFQSGERFNLVPEVTRPNTTSTASSSTASAVDNSGSDPSGNRTTKDNGVKKMEVRWLGWVILVGVILSVAI
ncbi:hypothetical protein BDQ17DRAFT_211354 [Cyathus striatus]|nr:hypothetical protein BDQ17DRAFT_211354 [Cyathus striatus]